jgi:hypothetical protein
VATRLVRDVEASIVEHIALRFAIFSFDKFDQLQPVRKAELLTRIVGSQVRLALRLMRNNRIGDEGILHNYLRVGP